MIEPNPSPAQSPASRLWWGFVHHCIAHPLYFLLGFTRFATSFHDRTALWCGYDETDAGPRPELRAHRAAADRVAAGLSGLAWHREHPESGPPSRPIIEQHERLYEAFVAFARALLDRSHGGTQPVRALEGRVESTVPAELAGPAADIGERAVTLELELELVQGPKLQELGATLSRVCELLDQLSVEPKVKGP